jgi:hypothetical protein
MYQGMPTILISRGMIIGALGILKKSNKGKV